MKQAWSFADKAIKDREHLVLVVVVGASGSVPGKPGAIMMVTKDSVVGTVGGGIAESTMIRRARSHRSGVELTGFSHTPDSGSLCLGDQRIALCALTPKEQPVIESIVATLDQGGCGVLRVSPGGLAFTAGARQARRFVEREASWTFEETIGPRDTLHIIGGGHVSLALSSVMATLPYRIVVLDDREQLPTMTENCHAHETRVIDYSAVRDHVADGEMAWVVIMTFGHHDDEAVLERLVDRRYRYLGLMGSRSKIRQIFSNLEAKGCSRVDLDRVHAPVGLPIGSHTPEEIAISIAAELIKVRNG